MQSADSPTNDLANRVISFWFGDRESPAFGQRREVWFKTNKAFDKEITGLFEHDYERAAGGHLEQLEASPEGCLTLILMLDQFPRNMYRGTPKAFETDAMARQVADSALARNFDAQLLPVQRCFLYLPFEHSENSVDQDRSVQLFHGLGIKIQLDYAVRHQQIVAQFGCFPHRNEILGRESTEEEIEFLKLPGASF